MSAEQERVFIGNGRYALDRLLGEGGGGSVHLAYDTSLGRWVAVKRLGPADESVSREARVMASFHHPNIVMIHDILEEEGGIYFVMELVLGQNLEELAEPLGEATFRDFAAQCLAGLGAAHSLNVVHRDIKPGNIMLDPLPAGGYRVKLLDFGRSRAILEPSLQTIDHSGTVLGSIFMMSPEQLCNEPLDLRTDLYSLGCVFYQALTLQRPFQGDSVPEVVAAHLRHSYHPLCALRPDLPAVLARWVERLFAFEREDRPASAEAALAALKHTETHSKAHVLSAARPGAAALAPPVIKPAHAVKLPTDPVVLKPAAIATAVSPVRVASQPVATLAAPAVAVVAARAASTPVVLPASVAQPAAAVRVASTPVVLPVSVAQPVAAVKSLAPVAPPVQVVAAAPVAVVRVASAPVVLPVSVAQPMAAVKPVVPVSPAVHVAAAAPVAAVRVASAPVVVPVSLAQPVALAKPVVPVAPMAAIRVVSAPVVLQAASDGAIGEEPVYSGDTASAGKEACPPATQQIKPVLVGETFHESSDPPAEPDSLRAEAIVLPHPEGIKT